MTATPPAEQRAEAGQTWQHVKRGTFYKVLTGAELQTVSGALVDGSALVIYQGDGGKVWAREEGEFLDGRFVPAPSLNVTGADEATYSANLRAAIDAGLKSFCSDTPDFTMSAAMRCIAADFILAQPLAFATRAAGEEYRRGLEDAAKVAETWADTRSAERSEVSAGGPLDNEIVARVSVLRRLATAIRALAPGEAGS